jgi:poly-gamma-glutamate synthesis protein (capsule biosynthesis protein)
VLFIIFFVPGISFAQGLRFYGDILLSRGIGEFANDNGELPLRKLIDSFLGSDVIQIANLEGAVGDTSQCAKGRNPCFNIKADLLNLLVGFDVINLQNNHSLDLGVKGLQDSIRETIKRNITPLGGKKFSVVIDTENGNIGIIALTDVMNNPNDREYVAMADSPDALKEIRRLREISTIVAVYLHWGRELDDVPTERMKELTLKFIQAGADIIVGTHPHVVGKVHCIQGKPVVYSLGNFLFDQKYEDTKRGAVLQCEINGKSKLTCALIGHETPLNSYLPSLVNNEPYKKENEQLALCAPEVQKTWTGMFSIDQKEKRLILKKDRNHPTLSYLEMYDLRTGKKELRSPSMPVVKLQPFDVNGDNILEIMLIQNIFSSLDNEVAKRVYIYSLDKNFHALWRGSALSRPLVDALFIRDRNNLPILIALHTSDSFLLRRRNTTERIVMGYRWNGFGFSGLKEIKLKMMSDHLSMSKGKLRLINNGMVVHEIPGSDFYFF